MSVKTSTPEELDALLDRMTPEQIEALKARIQAMEPEADGAEETEESADLEEEEAHE